MDENGNIRIAISPNEDGNKDLVEYKTVALRNIKTFMQLSTQQAHVYQSYLHSFGSLSPYHQMESRKRVFQLKYHVIKANADGSFDLPENIDKKNIYYYVEDFAGNVDYVSLAYLVRDQNRRVFQLRYRHRQHLWLYVLQTVEPHL